MLYADLLSLLTHYVTKIQVKELGEWLCGTRGKDCTSRKGLIGWDTANTGQKDFCFLILFLFYGCQIPERDKLHWLCH